MSVLKESGFFFFAGNVLHISTLKCDLYGLTGRFSRYFYFSLSPVADKTQLFHFHNVKSLEMLERGG